MQPVCNLLPRHLDSVVSELLLRNALAVPLYSKWWDELAAPCDTWCAAVVRPSAAQRGPACATAQASHGRVARRTAARDQWAAHHRQSGAASCTAASGRHCTLESGEQAATGQTVKTRLAAWPCILLMKLCKSNSSNGLKEFLIESDRDDRTSG